ncbi:Uncharacterised protein [Xylophilus ampelinus]|nr:DUF3606 domain-containing protein [Variovorax sp.]VTY30985.1 Uncharacterised protein [Xylophilus ampelinus]
MSPPVFPHVVLRQPAWIDLDSHDDVSVWMGEFGVTETVLRQAVQRVGRSPHAVRGLLCARTRQAQAGLAS